MTKRFVYAKGHDRTLKAVVRIRGDHLDSGQIHMDSYPLNPSRIFP
jgi:hypothetical protein